MKLIDLTPAQSLRWHDETEEGRHYRAQLEADAREHVASTGDECRIVTPDGRVVMTVKLPDAPVPAPVDRFDRQKGAPLIVLDEFSRKWSDDAGATEARQERPASTLLRLVAKELTGLLRVEQHAGEPDGPGLLKAAIKRALGTETWPVDEVKLALVMVTDDLKVTAHNVVFYPQVLRAQADLLEMGWRVGGSLLPTGEASARAGSLVRFGERTASPRSAS